MANKKQPVHRINDFSVRENFKTGEPLKSDDIIKIDSDFLRRMENTKTKAVTKERVLDVEADIRDYISFWRWYPDLFIDYLAELTGSPFKFFFYQRVFLRAAMRHRLFFGTFPRAFSKSFLSVMLEMVTCVLYPGIKVFMTSGGKEQANGIAIEKVNEIIELIPAFKNEIIFERGEKGSKMTKDNFSLKFKNGSIFDVVAVRQSTRGGRRHSGLIDEVILIDGEEFSAVVLPLMNVSRRTAAGEVDPNDTRNKSQIYITSAGFKNHFSYKKQIQLLVWQIVTPGSAIVLGGTWRTPVKMGLLESGFVREMKQDGTFSEVVFNREYESVWAGSAVESFFTADVFDAGRELKDAEYSLKDKAPKMDEKSWYVIGIDVGRNGDETIVTVVKVRPGAKGVGTKHVVMIRTIENMPFDRQAVIIKQEWEKYRPKHVVVDANGVGFGLIDVLVLPTIDKKTGVTYPPFGLANDEKKIYKNLELDVTPVEDVLWMMKATNDINSEGYTNLLGQMGSKKLKFLVTERDANARFKELSSMKRKTALHRQQMLSPYIQTSILKDELMNLTQSETSATFKLERITKAVGKDRVSSLMYAMYVIKTIEDKEKRRKKQGLSHFMMFN